MTMARTTIASARTAPTDRSIPPVRITTSIPRASSAFTDVCRAIPARLPVVRNDGDESAKIATSRIRPASAPSWKANSVQLRRGSAGAATADGSGCDDMALPHRRGQDPFLVDLVARQLRDDAAASHDEDPVAHAHDLR